MINLFFSCALSLSLSLTSSTSLRSSPSVSASSLPSSLFRPIQTASPSLTVQIPYFVPEGLTYHEETDRVILASLATGQIRSFPNTNQLTGKPIEADSLASTLLYSGSFKGTNTPIVGVKVYGNTLYGAVGALPPLPGPFYGGLLILNLLNTSDVELIDFSSLANDKLMTPNDVVYSEDANAIFVTDFYSYRIFKYSLSTKTVSLFLENGILCTVCIGGGLAYDGPNGIAAKDDYLLVARSGTISLGSTPALIKIPINSPASAAIIPVYPANTPTESILDGADGLLFDSEEDILYLTSNGKGLIVAIRSKYSSSSSSSAWSTGQVVSTYAANCKNNDPSTSTIVPETGDLLVICTELFGAGPYPLNRLSGIANNYAASESFSYDLNFPNMLPESLVYQPSTDSIIYSSYGTGRIYATSNPSVPPSSDFTTLTKTIKQVAGPYPAGNTLYQPLGIQLDPLYDNMMWVAYNSMNGQAGGIYRCNSLNGDCDVILDLVDVAYSSFFNDVSIDPVDGRVFSTDMGGTHRIQSHLINSIYRADTSSSWSIDTKLIAQDLCVDCSNACDGSGYCGPNGIALIPNGKKKATALLTGVFSMTPGKSGMFRVDIATGTKTSLTLVPDTFIDHPDGIRFDSEGEFLFVASFGTDAIIAYYSCDDWKTTLYVAGVFSGGCSDGTNTAITYTSAGDLIVTCVNNFGAGPYTSTRIKAIRSRLLGVSYSSIGDYCEGKEPFQTDSDSNNNSNGNDDDSEESSAATALYVVIVVTALILVIGAIMVWRTYSFYQRKLSELNLKSSSELTSVENAMRK